MSRGVLILADFASLASSSEGANLDQLVLLDGTIYVVGGDANEKSPYPSTDGGITWERTELRDATSIELVRSEIVETWIDCSQDGSSCELIEVFPILEQPEGCETFSCARRVVDAYRQVASPVSADWYQGPLTGPGVTYLERIACTPAGFCLRRSLGLGAVVERSFDAATTWERQQDLVTPLAPTPTVADLLTVEDSILVLTRAHGLLIVDEHGAVARYAIGQFNADAPDPITGDGSDWDLDPSPLLSWIWFFTVASFAAWAFGKRLTRPFQQTDRWRRQFGAIPVLLLGWAIVLYVVNSGPPFGSNVLGLSGPVRSIVDLIGVFAVPLAGFAWLAVVGARVLTLKRTILALALGAVCGWVWVVWRTFSLGF